jgi:hypothetical protein
MKKFYLFLLLVLQTGAGYLMAQNVGINANGAAPDAKAMLDISSTTSGLLIPRMTTVQRDAITAPALGLQVYNLTTNTLDIYRGAGWESTAYVSPSTTVVNVYSLADLPKPVGNVITLASGKMYSFFGLVNIGTNYIDLNGAALRGNNPVTDGIMSSTSGAILRSTNQHVFMLNLLVMLNSNATTAFDFSDSVGDKSCNLVSGNNVKQTAAVTNSAGLGQISGFRAVILLQNYFDVTDGLKLTGNMGRFICGYTLIGSIASGKAGIEFLPGLNVQDVDISNTHFIYTGSGQIGVKMNAGATVDFGRMTTDMFRNVSTPTSGFDGSTAGWSMLNNTGIPNTRAHAFLTMNDNRTATTFSNTSTYYKILGTTSLIRSQKFTASDNKVTYTGKTPTSVRVTAVVAGKAPSFGSADYTIVIGKNGTAFPQPQASIGALLNNQGFQIVLESDIDLVTGDYLEVAIRSNSTGSLVVSDLQFRVSE